MIEPLARTPGNGYSGVVRAHRDLGWEPRAGTLGDLLYGNGSGIASEEDWAALVAAVAAGDGAALQALYERTHRIVFTLAVRLTRSRESAEEVTVDVFHGIWRGAAGYDPAAGTVVAWIMNQARSRAIDRVRYERRKKRVDPSPEAPAPERPQGSPERALQGKQEAERVRGALTALTAPEREAIETAFFSGLTYTETAARLDQPVGTIKTRIRSGLAKLRQALGER